jgi:cysteine desulfurase
MKRRITMKPPVYLDYNATTPLDTQVIEAMLPYLKEHFGNPSSTHFYGEKARQAVSEGRKSIANLLGVDASEIIFTSGGSESNNYAIKGSAIANSQKGNHIITTSIEHPAVLEVCRYLEKNGFEITILPVDSTGLVDPDLVEKSITSRTILISVMHANNEVGTVQPVSEIGKIARNHGILFHSDAAQSLGKIPVFPNEMQVDLLSIAGHKIYAPKGIGALYIRSGIRLEKLVHGAGHEMNCRAGTENVASIVALGKACEIIGKSQNEEQRRLKQLRDIFERELQAAIGDLKINGHAEKRLPNTSSIGFPNLEANNILASLHTVAASPGAACHSNEVKISHVLKAMKVPVSYAMGTVRFSLGRFTTSEEIDLAVEEIKKVIRNL